MARWRDRICWAGLVLAAAGGVYGVVAGQLAVVLASGVLMVVAASALTAPRR